MNLDRRISTAIFNTHGKRPWVDKIAIVCARELVIVEALALGVVMMPVLAHIEGRPMRLADIGQAAPLVLLLVAFAWGFAVLLELLIKRPRPYTALNKKPLDHFWTPTPGMPSSHASIAFALALPTLSIGPAWIPALFFLAAVIIAAGRVYVGVHYVSDVIAGAVLGCVSAIAAGTFGFWLFGVLGI